MEVNVEVEPDWVLDQMTAKEIVEYVIDNYSFGDCLQEIDVTDVIEYYDIEVKE